MKRLCLSFSSSAARCRAFSSSSGFMPIRKLREEAAQLEVEKYMAGILSREILSIAGSGNGP
jgi:hypothetical protein